jgi:hypothetical protein
VYGRVGYTTTPQPNRRKVLSRLFYFNQLLYEKMFFKCRLCKIGMAGGINCWLVECRESFTRGLSQPNFYASRRVSVAL